MIGGERVRFDKKQIQHFVFILVGRADRLIRKNNDRFDMKLNRIGKLNVFFSKQVTMTVSLSIFTNAMCEGLMITYNYSNDY